MSRAQNAGVGMQLVWPGEFSRAGHRHRMAPSRAPFRGKQIIPALAFVEMGRFGESELRPSENEFSFTDKLALAGRIFLQHNSTEAIISWPMVPKHVQEIFAAVVIMKKRGIEAAAVEVNRIGPIAIDARARDEIIVEVAQ